MERTSGYEAVNLSEYNDDISSVEFSERSDTLRHEGIEESHGITPVDLYPTVESFLEHTELLPKPPTARNGYQAVDTESIPGGIHSSPDAATYTSGTPQVHPDFLEPPQQSEKFTTEIQSSSAIFSHEEKHVPGVAREWIPVLLRTIPAFSLALSCWFMVGALEVLDVIARKEQGFGVKNRHQVNTSRYLPTVGVIVLGFVWRSLVRDVKKIMPWAAMTNKWAEASESVLLNYIDDMDILSVWKSARRRHWAVFLGLLGGLLVGALVPFANGLIYVNLSYETTENTSVLKTTTFDFSNQSMAVPMDDSGNKPFAALASIDQPNGYLPLWTSDRYAFESYEILDAGGTAKPKRTASMKSTLAAEIQAFYGILSCKTVRISTKLGNDATKFFDEASYGYDFIANNEDLILANCSLPSVQHSVLEWEANGTHNTFSTQAWLNVTLCSKDPVDMRITATVVQASKEAIVAGNITHPAEVRTVGLLCRPEFYMAPATIEINSTTARILKLRVHEDRAVLTDPGISTTIVQYNMENPQEVQDVLQYVTQDTDTIRGWNLFSDPSHSPWQTYAWEYATVGLDPFFNRLTRNDTSMLTAYLDDSGKLAIDVSAYFSRLFAQVAHAFARNVTRVPLQGSVTYNLPKLLVNQYSLRAMQSILTIIGLIAVSCGTFLRPKTCLTEDPATLAAMSIIVSASRQCDEQFRCWKNLLNESGGRSGGPVRYRLTRASQSVPMIEAGDEAELGNRQAPRNGKVLSAGYRPVPLHALSRVALLTVLSCIIVGLVVLFALSNRLRGFPLELPVASAAWSYLPITVLVLLGYGLQGVDSALQSQAPYYLLRQNRTSGRKSMMTSPANQSIFSMPFKGGLMTPGRAVFAASLVTLIYPAVKIVTAGLYTPTSVPEHYAVAVQVDTSVIDGFETLYGLDPSLLLAFQNGAIEYSTWIQDPQMDFPAVTGTIDNLVFSNMTGLELRNGSVPTATGDAQVRVPAVAISTQCQVLGPENFNLSVWMGTRPHPSNIHYVGLPNDTLYFQFGCATDLCRRLVLGYSAATFTPYSVALNGSNLTSWYQGEFALQDQAYTGKGPPQNTSIIAVLLADFSSVTGPIGNLTTIPTEPTTATKKWFNVSLPTITGVYCNRTFTRVEIDAIFTRGRRVDANETDDSLPWAASAYIKETLTYQSEFKSTAPIEMLPGGALKGPSIADGSLGWKFITNYQRFQVGNLTGLLDPEQLKAAVETMIPAFCAQQINLMRGYVQPPGHAIPHNLLSRNPYSQTGSMRPFLRPEKYGIPPGFQAVNFSGTFSCLEERIRQEKGPTIALLVLLTVVLACAVIACFTTPLKAVLPREPSSIAAQASMLTGSELVRRLREEEVHSVKDTRIWDQRFGLGWWIVRNKENDPFDSDGTDRREMRGSVRMRWGIDVGTPDCKAIETDMRYLARGSYTHDILL